MLLDLGSGRMSTLVICGPEFSRLQRKLTARFLYLYHPVGETIIITKKGVTIQQCIQPRTFAPDIFEYVYFARPDSVLDGISVYRSRMAMGDALAANTKKVLEAAGIVVDVVIPVPDTSRVAALQVAQSLNLPYREGFVKNRYIGRTFIMPGQEIRSVLIVDVPEGCKANLSRLDRRKNVRRKLNAMALEFSGKVVLLVDGEESHSPPLPHTC